MAKNQKIIKTGTFNATFHNLKRNGESEGVIGRQYRCDLEFSFSNQPDYQSSVRKLLWLTGGYVDRYINDAFIVNPQDGKLIETVQTNGLKLYTMSLCYNDFCNPTIENLSKEIFVALKDIAKRYNNKHSSVTRFFLSAVKIYSDQDYGTICLANNIDFMEEENVLIKRKDQIEKYLTGIL